MHTIHCRMFYTVHNGVKNSTVLQELAGDPGYYRPSGAMALWSAPLVLKKRFDPFLTNFDIHILFR